jgi:hypothetical protein
MFFPFAMDVLLCRGCIYLCMGVFISMGALWTFFFVVGVFTSVGGGDFTLPGMFFPFAMDVLLCPWVYLPLYGRIYFCGGDFTLPGMFFPFAMDVLLCRGCIYLCMGVFISVGAISHCQECFFHLLWTFCFVVGVFTSVWAYLFLWGRFHIARNVFSICYGRFALSWVYLPLYGRSYFCGGDFTLPGMFLQFAMDVLLCRGCIYLCVGVFISVGAIFHCQERFANCRQPQPL